MKLREGTTWRSPAELLGGQRRREEAVHSGNGDEVASGATSGTQRGEGRPDQGEGEGLDWGIVREGIRVSVVWGGL